MTGVPRERWSYQLFTARTQMAADPEGTLRVLADAGYPQVEHAGFADVGPERLRAAADAAGLAITSGHENVPFPYDQARWLAALERATTTATTMLVEPMPVFAWRAAIALGEVRRDRRRAEFIDIPVQTWLDYAAALNRAAADAADTGVRVGYHHHDVELLPLAEDPTLCGLDLLLEHTDADLTLDVYWCAVAGLDPVAYLREHGDRIARLHVKDLAVDGRDVAPGKGTLDLGAIFAAARDAQVELYTVEQDNAGDQALETARQGARALGGGS